MYNCLPSQCLGKEGQEVFVLVTAFKQDQLSSLVYQVTAQTGVLAKVRGCTRLETSSRRKEAVKPTGKTIYALVKLVKIQTSFKREQYGLQS